VSATAGQLHDDVGRSWRAESATDHNPTVGGDRCRSSGLQGRAFLTTSRCASDGVAPLVLVGELRVIDPQAAQDRRVEIVQCTECFVTLYEQSSVSPIVMPCGYRELCTCCVDRGDGRSSIASIRGLGRRLAAPLAPLSGSLPRIAAFGDRRTPTPARRGQSFPPSTASIHHS
jgi:hypothetical protein